MAKKMTTGIEIYVGNLLLHKINEGESKAKVKINPQELNEYIAMVEERLKTEFGIYNECDRDLGRVENYTDIFNIDTEDDSIKLRPGVKKSHLTENFYSTLNNSMQHVIRYVNIVWDKVHNVGEGC